MKHTLPKLALAALLALSLPAVEAKTVGQVARSVAKYATLPGFALVGAGVGHVIGAIECFVAPFSGAAQGVIIWHTVWKEAPAPQPIVTPEASK